jgi:hypothetical protein
MNYYSFIESTNIPKSNINQNLTKKDKFFVKDDPSENVPGYYKMKKEKCEIIDNETNLLNPGIQTKDKTQLMLKKELNPSDYNIIWENGLKKYKNDKTEFYYNNRDIGPGRGFGNLNISNEIRSGGASRNTTKEFKEKQEGQQLFEFQFQYLDKNYQNPNNIIMPIPRGGAQTRKQNQLSINTMRSFQSKDQYEDNEVTKTIKFNY